MEERDPDAHAATKPTVETTNWFHVEGVSTEEFWDGFYQGRDQVWSGNPNVALVREVSDLAPGTALDLGSGEGADAIWLAGRGWSVTAVDVSATALERGARAAEAAGVAERIEWQRHDLAESFPAGAFDLVSAQYLQSPVEMPRAQILRAAAAAVKPGGVLLVAGHAGFASWQEPVEGFRFPSGDEVLEALELDPETWQVLRNEDFEREHTSPDGEPGTRADNVVKARRLPVAGRTPV